MLPDFDQRGGVRRCTQTDRVLRPTDHYFSLLREEGEKLVREDYACDAWQGAEDGVFAWWESKPAADQDSRPLAPNEVLLKLFDQWADEPEQAVTRYVLTLLLVRRRVFRIESNRSSHDGPHATLCVYCPRRNETYELRGESPTPDQAQEIQQRLSSLLAA